MRLHNIPHTITPVFPEGLGRGVPMHTHGSPVCRNEIIREHCGLKEDKA